MIERRKNVYETKNRWFVSVSHHVFQMVQFMLCHFHDFQMEMVSNGNVERVCQFFFIKRIYFILYFSRFLRFVSPQRNEKKKRKGRWKFLPPAFRTIWSECTIEQFTYVLCTHNNRIVKIAELIAHKITKHQQQQQEKKAKYMWDRQDRKKSKVNIRCKQVKKNKIGTEIVRAWECESVVSAYVVVTKLQNKQTANILIGGGKSFDLFLTAHFCVSFRKDNTCVLHSCSRSRLLPRCSLRAFFPFSMTTFTFHGIFEVLLWINGRIPFVPTCMMWCTKCVVVVIRLHGSQHNSTFI